MYGLIEKSCLCIIDILYHQTIYCTILFVIFFGFAYLLKGKSPYWRLGLWLLILLRLLLPTDLSFSLSARNLLDDFPLIDKFNVSMEKVSNRLGINQQSYQNFELNRFERTGDKRDKKTVFERNLNKDLHRSISWPIVLAIVWFLGCLISMIFFLNKICSINRVLNHSSLLQDKRITAFLDYWRQAFNIRRSVNIFSSDEFLSPFTVGLFRPKIFIPQPLLKYADIETINSIIAHEMVHIKRLDDLWIRLQNVLQIIYFFHPVVWYANKQISLARERICDYIVLAKRVIPPKVYGKGVINVLEFNLFGYRPVEPLPCFSNHKKIFEHRIRDILKEGTMKKPKTLCIVLAVCLLGLFLLPLSGNQTGATQSEKVTGNEKIEFIWPMKPGWISSEYGYRISPFSNQNEFHTGIDISARIGTPIYAVASGIVEKVEFTTLRGHQVTLQHGHIYQTYYAHCDKILVQEGQTVKSGDIIATCGSSGRSTGPHLHFEIRKNGIPVDPLKNIVESLKYLDSRFTDLRDGTVHDSETDLIWLKNADCLRLTKWDDAMAAAEGLEDGECGLKDGSVAGDWRLPTKEELERVGTDPPTTWDSGKPPVNWTTPGSPFENVKYYYWSSTEYVISTASAWSVYMANGIVYHFPKDCGFYVWPVRSIN